MNDIYYFHVDTSHADYALITSGLVSKFSTIIPSNKLSINLKDDGTESLIKLVAEPAWIDDLEAAFIKGHPALIATYTPANHNLALALVTNIAWTGIIL